MHRITKLVLIVCLCLSTFSPSALAVDYARNVREDRGVWITFLVGAAVFVGTFTPGVYFLAPQGNFNMEPNCPQGSPVLCCDAKAPGINVTSAPTNCEAPTDGFKCTSPKVAYCTGNAIAADQKHQDWALRVGIPLTVIGSLGFLTAVIGASVGMCCFGTCALAF